MKRFVGKSGISRTVFRRNDGISYNKLYYLSTSLKTKMDDNKLTNYVYRHIGPQLSDDEYMLSVIGVKTKDELISKVVPPQIRLENDLKLPDGVHDYEALNELYNILSNNKIYKSYIGIGYYNTHTPKVILRNIIENPSWYTPYTPYQAEISQGRLEMLINYQTMVCDLTKMEISNASLLDESTACAEAMTMALNISKNNDKMRFIVSNNVNINNIAVMKTRAENIGITLDIMNDDDILKSIKEPNNDIYGVLVQYPTMNGAINDYTSLCSTAKDNDIKFICCTDLLACCVITPPGEFGCDIVVGSSQRFGVPMGYGGPYAAFLATKKEFMRKMPGRIIGVSKDTRNKPALRMALQTREQHIRREKATSNICTAQALLANVAASYGIWHGPDGLKSIAKRVNLYANILNNGLKQVGCEVVYNNYFDTITVKGGQNSDLYVNKGYEYQVNIRKIDDELIGISLDETTELNDLQTLINIFGDINNKSYTISSNDGNNINSLKGFERKSEFMTHDVFNQCHSETAMMRYLYNLEKKDLGLNTAMIPLGSCTMKLNSANVMTPLTWNITGNIHPFVPLWQAKGYDIMLKELESWLAECTQFYAVSLQPNSGAQGEYAGLLCIKRYQESKGYTQRNVCLVPSNAHGTNPASAAALGMKVVVIKCDKDGHVDLNDLKEKVNKYKDTLCAAMVTYPGTFGVFEDEIKTVTKIVHDGGGLVYMDGANFQAQLGYTSPATIGADVCHLNLHKTFCIPHGGGGPGLGPIGVTKELSPFLPTHPIININDNNTFNDCIASSPFSSASIATIPWMYIKMMGNNGLKNATTYGILNANYILKKLEPYYNILYLRNGMCAHEFILDISKIKKNTKVTPEDISKRLMDYGFHAPTQSWPVIDGLMIEPTESEPLNELDRLVNAFISIKNEINDIADGNIDYIDSPLKNAPHTIDMILSDNWDKKYSRETAAVNKFKSYWPTVGRIDNVYGDSTPHCTCPDISTYQ